MALAPPPVDPLTSGGPAATPALTPTDDRDRPSGSGRTGKGRLAGIDIARALALMGMFTQHVQVSGADGATSTGWVQRVFEESAGRASVLFFVLSGVSLSLIQRRGSASASTGALVRRGLLLFGGGLLLTASLWPASILQHYGIAFLAAPWLLRLGRRGLASATALGLIAGPVLLLYARNWSDEVTGLWSGRAGSWAIETVWDISVSGLYPMVLWIGFFTLGMLLGRLDLGDRRTLLRLAVVAATATVAVGLATAALTDRYGDVTGFEDFSSAGSPGDDFSFGIEQLDDESKWKKLDEFTELDVPADWRALYDVTGHSGHIGWTAQTGALAVTIMALALRLPSVVTTALRPLAIMGSMSLTAYLVHIVLVTDVYDRFASEADWPVVAKEWTVAALIVAMMVLCVVFHRLIRVGPLEWLLRQFTSAGSGGR